MNILHVDKTGQVSLHGLTDAGHDAPIPSDVTVVWSSTDESVFTVAGSGNSATVTPVGKAGGVASVHADAKHGDGSVFPVSDAEITLADEVATHATIDFVEN